MAITHLAATRTALAGVIITDLDAGAGVANFVLQAAAVEIATMPLSKPSFVAGAAGVIDMDVTPIPEDASATGGTVDSWEMQDSDANMVFAGAVGDITLSKNPIDASDTVQCTSFSYTAPA